jgi:hypothetical protein
VTNEEKRDMLVRLAGLVGYYPRESLTKSHLLIWTGTNKESVAGRIDRDGTVGGWNPMENIEHAWMLVEALRKRGFEVYVNAEKHGYEVAVYLNRNEFITEGQADAAPLAISLAADEAIRGRAA